MHNGISDFKETFKILSDCTPVTISNHSKTKENVFDYDTRKTSRAFIDHCGSWIKSSLKSNFYLKTNTGDFEHVHKKQDHYFRREKLILVLGSTNDFKTGIKRITDFKYMGIFKQIVNNVLGRRDIYIFI